jgi:enterochelin esterase-like enzyme
MKFLPFLLAFMLLLFSVPRARGQESGSTIVRTDFFSSTLNRTYQYTAYLPPGYDGGETRYPVIYLLHGRGDTMDAWLNAFSALDELIASGSVPPIIAVLPDVPSSDRASYYVDSAYTGSLNRAEPVETAFMNDLIPHIEATYRTLTEREGRLVGGYSMGGYGALRYAMAYPDKFVGALVLSPAVYIPLPPLDSSTREFGAFGNGASLFDDEVYQRLNYPALVAPVTESGLPLSMFIAVGDDEWKNPNPEDVLHDLDVEAHMVFNQVVRIPNVSAEFRVYDGGHDWDVWRRGFIEGMQYLAGFIKGEGDPSATPLSGTLSGSAGEDYAGGVAAEGDGNIYQALSASDSINDTPHLGELDVYLTRRAPDGSALWTRGLGTSAADRAYGLALDSRGGVIVAGYTSGDLDSQHAGNAGNDAFVAKFSADGEQQWILQFGDPAEADRAYALAVAGDDSIYVGGYTRGALNGQNAGDKDIFLARVSPAGEIEWVEQFGGAGEDKGLSLAVDGDMVYLSGVAGSGTALSTPVGDLDAFLAAYTAGGEQVWVRQFGSAGWDEATGVFAANGIVYVTGFAGDDFGEHTLAGDKDTLVAAFDSAGDPLWTDLVGTGGSDKGADVRVDAAGDVYVAGYTDGNLAGNSGRYDVVLIKYDPAGAILWTKQIGTNQNDGADEYAEENLFLTIAGERLLLTGLTGGGVVGTAPFGSGDVFLSEFDLDGEQLP